MLRYYEQMGLIKSNRKKDYAYRVYDEDAISRLRITKAADSFKTNSLYPKQF